MACHDADPNMGWFECGVTMGVDHRRKGYAAEAVGMLLRFMFAERRYHRCEARILAHNTASLALHRRLGFAEEGRLRDRVGLLAEDFTQLHATD
ncbi:GNAT family N-acetyltransferase [Streptomyces sp. NPDC090075]|uniref:GNAT family N-acetyltransferase n=1 Tax=Streptomyces sp. NPDC090075 TaxID=3365937 RepID=UPI003804B25B